MSLDNYTNLEPFRFWCQTVLPSVYDESLSYYELLCKVVNYLNETMKDVTILHDEFVTLKSFVDDYFNNLDVQEEINNKLDEMATDGSLDALIQQFIPDAVSEWLEEYFHPSEPSAVSLDSSLMIANSAADSKAAGDAIFGVLRNNVNTRNAIKLTAMAKYTPDYATMTSITEMPPYTWMQGTGTQIAAIIPGASETEDPFPWRDELRAYPSSLYVSNSQDRNSINYTWEISTNYGNVLYRGYSVGSSSNIWFWVKGLTMVGTDTSLMVDGAAADSKATGDEIFGVRRNRAAVRNAIRLTAMAKYTPDYATMTSITEMPPYTWMQGTGTQIEALIPGKPDPAAEDPFPWRDELRAYPSSLYVSNSQDRNSINYTWEISTNYGNVLYRGYSTGENSNTWFWKKGTDTSLMISNSAADSKATGDEIFGVLRNKAAVRNAIRLTAMAKYTPDYATMTSITEMPPYTWMQGTGTQIEALIPGKPDPAAEDPFPWRDELKAYPYALYVSNSQDRNSINYTWEISTNYGNVLYRGYSAGADDKVWFWARGLTRVSTDTSLTINGAAADAQATAAKIEEAKEETAEFVEEPNPVARELYTDFYDETREDPVTHVATYWDGWYNYAGGISGKTTIKHSEKFRIRPGVRYYTSNSSATANRVIGVFFDRNGNFLKPLFSYVNESPPTSDYVVLTEYAYDKPYRGASFAITDDEYVKIYTFVAPSDAYYMGLNLQGGVAIKNNDINEGIYSYRNYVSSFPIFAGLGMGNVIIRENDPIYQKTKDKRLMVLGPSTVMIDRLLRPASEPPADSGRYQQYIIGAQEYLCPWYKAVDSYGYSGAAWGYGNTPGSATVTGAVSIYTRVFGGSETVYNNLHQQVTVTVSDGERVDFSGHDEYLIFTNSNGTTVANVGTIDSIVTVDGVEVLDKTKQMSALHAIVREIITQNKRAKIYLCGQRYRNYPYDDPSSEARRPALITMYEESKKLAVRYNLNFIDMNEGTSLNPMVDYTEAPGLYYYDSIHPSNLGNQRVGLWMRQNILGF